MTIDKLARYIVDEYFDGSPNSERYLYQVEQEVKRMQKEKEFRISKGLFPAVIVEVE